jgi:general L-amino acid transport system permease protein
MNAAPFQPIAARPAPRGRTGALHWVRRQLFGSWGTGAATVLLGALLLWALPRALDWALWGAVWRPDLAACRAAQGAGACWGVIAEKYRLILFGRYPYEQQWRPLVATAALAALVGASCIRAFWKPWLAALWAAVLAAFFVLMYGAVAGLARVETDRWGGLPLTLLLSTLSIVTAFPLALAVALGRRSGLPAIRALCTVYVELVRGVPLISLLFMASFMFPLFLPQGMTVDVLARVLVGITLFAAAYLAEVVRGGLQAVPKGQVEAAATLGLSYWQTQRKIVLPQALAMVVPSLMNSFISILKDTSLVSIVSLYELTGSMDIALNSDADWKPFKLQAYFFIALIYFTLCFGMSRYSRWVEARLNHGRPH